MQPLAVLLLEDTDADAARVTEWLAQARHARFELHRVATLADALQALGERAYDVVLTDLCVPDSKGPDTFRSIAAAARDTPVLVQSGLEQESLAISAVAEGAQDYLVKRHMSGPLVVRALLYAVERARSDRALRESEERYKLAVDGARDGIWDWNLRTGRLFLSSRWKQMLGFDDGGVGETAEDWFALVHPDDLPALTDGLRRHLGGTTPHLEVEHRVRTAQGTWRWMLTRGVAVRDGGEAVRLAGSMTDITARRAAEEQLRHAAMHDALTGLPNRALLLDRLAQAVRRSRRQRGQHFAVLFLDLDRFKVVNDSLGHLVGDELLVAVARRLVGCVRPADTVSRLGGDEFAILLEGVDASDHGAERAAERASERIQRALGVPVRVGGTEVFPSVSIGIAHSSQGYDSPEDVLRDADIAMYRAKHAGRGRHQVFESALGALARDRLQVESGLCRAIERDEVLIHYQPIVDLADERPVALEALVRWNCPGRGLLLPGAFMSAAEETGQVVALGRWVLEAACRDHVTLGRRLPWLRDTRLNVNLSARQLGEASLPHQVESTLTRTGMDPKNLVLELTETALIDYADRAVQSLAALRSLGVSIHLDDFGSGYSSLSYLHQFPIDSIKIDRCFVAGMLDRPSDGAIVRAVLALAASLGLEVIAEGIEKAEQRRCLQELHCRYGQGYLFGRPAPLLELAA